MSPSAQKVPDQLSNEVIPAVRGEFYRYTAQFTPDTPLFCMMKCKANKSRPTEEADELGEELDLVFVFGEGGILLCSPDSEAAAAALGSTETLNHTSIAQTRLFNYNFEQIRGNKDTGALVQAYRVMETRKTDTVVLTWGAILAVRTNSGKYGLIHVVGISRESVEIEACHILL